MKIEEENSEEKRISVPEVISNSEMLQRMQAQIDDLTKQKEEGVSSGANETRAILKELVAGLKERPDSEKYGGEDTYTRPEDIDPNDRLEIGVTFFSHQVAYVIADDKRDGHNVRTPFGRAIKFVYQSTKAVKHGNETVLHNISAYTSFSKMEVEWLKSHKFYGTIFFSTHKDAFSTDAKRATKLARMILTLERYDAHKIVKMARSLGLPPSDDVPALRISIANFNAEKELKAERDANKIKVKDAIIEKDILSTPVT